MVKHIKKKTKHKLNWKLDLGRMNWCFIYKANKIKDQETKLCNCFSGQQVLDKQLLNSTRCIFAIVILAFEGYSSQAL